MELVTALLSSLLLVISPVGFVVDQVAEDAIRGQLISAESLDVRVDNGPSHQLLQGRVNQVRIAGRGIVPIEGLRLEVADLETDPIDLEFRSLRQGQVVLDEPFQGAVHLVVTEADINAFLLSPFVQDRLSRLTIGGLAPAQARERDRYRIANPEIDFIKGNRIRVAAQLEDLVQGGGLFIKAEVGIAIVEGSGLQLIAPEVTADGTPIPAQLLRPYLDDFAEQLSLQQLEAQGITARVLNLAVEDNSLDLAIWARVDPSVTAPDGATR